MISPKQFVAELLEHELYSTDPEIQAAWTEGYEASPSASSDDNPYPPESGKWHAWASGWIDGTVEDPETAEMPVE